MMSSAPVMNVDELAGDFGELRAPAASRDDLDAVHGERARVDLALGIEEAVEFLAGRPAIEDLHASDFDDAMAGARFEAGGFHVEDDLPHGARV